MILKKYDTPNQVLKKRGDKSKLCLAEIFMIAGVISKIRGHNQSSKYAFDEETDKVKSPATRKKKKTRIFSKICRF